MDSDLWNARDGLLKKYGWSNCPVFICPVSDVNSEYCECNQFGTIFNQFVKYK